MNFSGLSRESFVGRTMRQVLRILPPELEVPVLQGKLRGARWVVSSGVHGYWLGSYEWEKRRLFEAITLPGAVVYDIGANVGFYTLLASRLVGPRGKVLAFEPLPRNVRFLRRHIAANHATNVIVYEGAVSDRPGVANFDASGNASMGGLSNTGQLEVPSLKLDLLVEEQSLPPPDLIKIDIEGGELRALHGGIGLLRRAHPSILLATHGPSIHSACCELLSELGYTLQPLRSGMSLSEVDELVATKPSMQTRSYPR